MGVAASRVRVVGPLAVAPGFVSELERLHYASGSAYEQARVMAQLSGWLAAEGLEASDLTPAVIARFVTELRRSGYRNARVVEALETLCTILPVRLVNTYRSFEQSARTSLRLLLDKDLKVVAAQL